MKYIINESRLESAITEYLNKIFPLDNVYLTNPTEYDDETGENYDDGTRIEFYLGDYGNEETIFRWYSCEYFNDDSPAQNTCPVVSLEYEYYYRFNSFFGDLWYEPFKKWFIESFDLPLKTVDDQWTS